MQRSWRNDKDKLTFIVCLGDQARDGSAHIDSVQAQVDDSPSRMAGDVNLFLVNDDETEQIEDSGNEDGVEPDVVGEVEIMIAETSARGKGLGLSVLLLFLY